MDPDKIAGGIQRELAHVKLLNLGDRSTTWCFWREASAVRVRFEVRHFRTAVDTAAFASTPRLKRVRVLVAIALYMGYELISGDFSVAFMYTPKHDEPGTCVEPPPELNLGPQIAWRLP